MSSDPSYSCNVSLVYISIALNVEVAATLYQAGIRPKSLKKRELCRGIYSAYSKQEVCIQS